MEEDVIPLVEMVKTTWDPKLVTMDSDLASMKVDMQVTKAAIANELSKGKGAWDKPKINRSNGKDLMPDTWGGIEDKELSFKTFRDQVQSWAAAVCPGEDGMQGKTWMEAATKIKFDEECGNEDVDPD